MLCVEEHGEAQVDADAEDGERLDVVHEDEVDAGLGDVSDGEVERERVGDGRVEADGGGCR